MPEITVNGAKIAFSDEGAGPPLVMLHSLGADKTLWRDLTALLPDHRIIAIDMRGHGASSVPQGPYRMGGLISDVEAVLDHLSVTDAVVIGLSVGGMIAQGLAVKRLDLVRAIVLMCTAAKLGQPDPWHARAAKVREAGMEAIVPDILDRWGSPDATLAKSRLLGTDPEGYAGVCEAIAGTDFYTPTSGLRLPTLGFAGNRDKSTPPDLVRETVDLVPGSAFHLIRGAGHLAPETHAHDIAPILHDFLGSIGHV